MSFFERPIITGEWHTGIDTFSFKAFKKNDKEVEIKIFKKRAFFVDRDLEMPIMMNNNEFYNNFVSILNTDQPLILKGNAMTGKWSCDPEDKANVLRSMPAEGEMEELQSAGGKRHKRSGHKRSGHKRSGHKRSDKRRKSHKRSDKKRSGKKRSGHKSRRH
jgi:hypothetical protein